jgi:hypothetical protein
VRPGARERLVFGGATAAALVHALDDAFLHRGAGVGLGQHALAAALCLTLGVTAIYAFPSLRPGLRAAIAFFLGVLATVNGILHVKHISAEGVAGGDVTGVLAFGAGAVLIGLAIAIPWLHRGEGPASRRRRWAYRVLVPPAALLLAFYTIVPMSIGLTETHKYRESIGPPPSADYREVTFEAGDGVEISAWYRPTQNGATILVVHGGGGDRTGAVAHARLLVRHGYGVLLHDARGRGRSEGPQNSFGWGWGEDVAGALAFLAGRDEVDPERIGGLGISTGADVLLEVAGQGDDLRAVVTDGAAAGSFEDWRRLLGVTAFLPFLAAEFATVKVTSGAESGPPLEDMVKRITSPVLLISGGREAEYDFNVRYERAAGRRPVEHWNLPDVGHTAAIRQAAPEYERRVTAFFDAALR